MKQKTINVDVTTKEAFQEIKRQYQFHVNKDYTNKEFVNVMIEATEEKLIRIKLNNCGRGLLSVE